MTAKEASDIVQKLSDLKTVRIFSPWGNGTYYRGTLDKKEYHIHFIKGKLYSCLTFDI